jgi:hypothetical protein
LSQLAKAETEHKSAIADHEKKFKQTIEELEMKNSEVTREYKREGT